MKCFADVIAKWPSYADLASDLELAPGIPALWKHRNSIPSEYWRRVTEKAAERGIPGVTLELLARFAESKADAA